MRKVLGLDLGVASIGWAFIEDGGNKSVTVKGMGVRVVPLGSDEVDEFTRGNPVTKNQKRRLKRGMRRGYYRYQLRKRLLKEALRTAAMLPTPELLRSLNPMELYGLRAKAAHQHITLPELGRVLLLLNEKRGYKSNRKAAPDEGDEKKQGEYLAKIAANGKALESTHQTIGQHLHHRIQNGATRIKGLVFPRQKYIEEFDQIWHTQAQHHPQTLTPALKKRIGPDIIFRQRPLKSQKGLVSKCRFELNHRVIPKSSPLNQVCKVWEQVNSITITDRYGNPLTITPDQRQLLYTAAIQKGKLNWTDVAKLLAIPPRSYNPDLRTKDKGIEGNTTLNKLRTVFEKLSIPIKDALNFELTATTHLREKTGELIRVISDDFTQQPLFRLWHLIYSVEEDEVLVQKLTDTFGFSPQLALALSKINFATQGYGGKSARAIRRILPHLMQGKVYSLACEAAGYKHSDAETVQEREARPLQAALQPLKKGALRNPTVERILNQMIHVVNAVLTDPQLGRPDEVRIELSRELRQNAKQRKSTYTKNNSDDRLHKEIADKLKNDCGFRHINRRLIEKYKLWHETDGLSLYSGERLQLSAFLKGEGCDIDHIIPQSRLFDDSFSNKVICELHHNRTKGNHTASDYMRSLGEQAYERFATTVQDLFEKGKITKRKRDYLLMGVAEIPQDFIDRQLRETQYITREALGLLRQVATQVNVSAGGVTAYLRRVWGWDEVLKQLNLAAYEQIDKVYEVTGKGNKTVKRIEESAWTKRDDHRHHAIDALAVACTRQAFIQRLNTLNAIMNSHPSDHQKLEDYIKAHQPFKHAEVAAATSRILISFKPGKRLATWSKNRPRGGKYENPQRTLSPRGPLSEESVYGKISQRTYKTEALGPSFTLEKAKLIANKTERALVLDRLSAHSNDPQKAFKNYKKAPILLPDSGEPLLTVSVIGAADEYVIRYKLDQNFKLKDTDSIVDKAVRDAVKARLAAHGDDPKKAFTDLDNHPIWLNEKAGIAIKSVRCTTGLKKVEPVRRDANGHAEAFVKPGNNHHIAIYRDPQGQLQECAVTFWEAFERKRLGLPVVIHHPDKAWDYVLDKLLPSLQPAEREQIGTSFEAKLPRPDWTYVVSLAQNEMFVWRMEMDELKSAIAQDDRAKISKHLYRVQKISESYYVFRHHLETKVDDKALSDAQAIQIGKFVRISSLAKMTGIKVEVDRLGRIKIAERP